MSRSRSRKRRIAVVTGTRAEFGLLQSTLAHLHANPRVELHLIATGMHLLPAFGNTVRDIANQGFRVAAKIPMQRGDDSPTDQAEGLARGVAGIAKYFHKNKIEAALVLGDRIEAMAGALAASTTGVRLAHVHGGDVAPGDFDGKLRDAITMLADLHLTATQQAARRVIGMRIDRETVHVVGAPGIDRLAELLREQSADRAKYDNQSTACAGTSPSPTLKGWGTQRIEQRGRGSRRAVRTERVTTRAEYALVAYHAYGRAARTEARVMTMILDVVRKAGLPRMIVAPNSDRGHTGVLDAIAKHAAKYGDEVVVHSSLPRDDFLRALIRARVLVGNSSAGLLEAPFAGTASIDVGDRQTGRTPGGRSVVRCNETRSDLIAALRTALRKRPRAGCETVYGSGAAGKQIAALLLHTP